MGNFTSEHVQWSPGPPRGTAEGLPLWSPGVGETITGYALCSQIVDLKMHYMNLRSVPCFGRVNFCLGCKTKVKLKWKGFLGVFRPGKSGPWLMEITKGAALSCPALTNPAFDLRGRQVSITRQAWGPNARCSASIDSDVRKTFKGPELNVRKALCIIWGISYVAEQWVPDLDAAKGGERNE